MHKKIAAELIDLAHQILADTSNNTVTELQQKALAIYEKLTVLKFVEANLNAFSENIAEKSLEETTTSNSELVFEKKVETETSINHEIKEFKKRQQIEEPTLNFSFEDEFKDVTLTETDTDLFEKATTTSEIKETIETKKKSLNDALFNTNLQIGLNDRIAFVKYLFNGSQIDFNRVLSQLNSFNTEDEAKNFLTEIVKPDYNWSGSEAYEQRLISLIERKFL